MLLLSFEITIGNYRFRSCASVSIESSWKSVGAKCSIELPSVNSKIAKLFKRGDAVTVKLGYDDKLQTEFTGFVLSIQPNIPIKIECEDEVFLLRKVQLKKDGENTKLSEVVALIKQQLPNIDIIVKEGLEMEFVGLRLDYNAADLLKKFQDENGLVSYFLNGKLYIGLPGYLPTLGRTVVFEQGRNVISTNLEYKTEEDRKIRFKVRGVDTKTKKMVEINVGDADEDGELRTLYYLNKSVEEMKVAAQADLKKFKYEGYEGSILGFGIPYVQATDSVRFKDQFFPERSGEYEVDAVKISSGSGGFRREITLGRKKFNVDANSFGSAPSFSQWLNEQIISLQDG